MVVYSIVFLPMTKRLKAAYPGVTKPWYSYDAGALGMFNNIGSCYNVLNHFGPSHGYYPKPSKSVLVVHPNNLAVGK